MSSALICLHIGCYFFSHILTVVIVIDGFGEGGRPAVGHEGAVPPNATLEITLELVSWKSVSDVTMDKKVLKKALKEGEGYERPNDGAVVQGNLRKNIIKFELCKIS